MENTFEPCNLLHFNIGVLKKTLSLTIIIFLILCPNDKILISFYIFLPRFSQIFIVLKQLI